MKEHNPSRCIFHACSATSATFVSWNRYSKLYLCSIFSTCHLWKCQYRVYWNLSYPLSILKVIFLRFKETLISFNHNQQCRHWKEDAIRPCAMGNVDSNFLSKATFNKTSIWFIFFSFLLHRILVLIFNMFIYAKVGHSKFVEMHRVFNDLYSSPIGILYLPPGYGMYAIRLCTFHI
jgi:hypothetical protein